MSHAQTLLEREFADIEPIALPYADESDAIGIVMDHPDIDGFLYTGVVPYSLVEGKVGHSVPAAYIPYSGASLYGALVELLAAGNHVSSISVDTLKRDIVLESFQEVGLKVDGVTVKPYEAGVTADRLADFHLEAYQRSADHTAITCLRSVYDRLRTQIPIVRLVPATESTRATIENLRLELAEREAGDAQLALGFLDVEGSVQRLVPPALAASTYELGTDVALLVTTRGLLHEYTGGFKHMGLLDDLAVRERAQLGFGIGKTAADAEALAHHALERARAISSHACVLGFGAEREFILGARGQDEFAALPVSLRTASQRTGISTATLSKLQAIAAKSENRLLASDVSSVLGVELRSARRTLKQLERAGLASPAGTTPRQSAGRPAVVYSLRFLPLPLAAYDKD